MGTWIEIPMSPPSLINIIVVPFVGTWIEILRNQLIQQRRMSYPLWVRGLKFLLNPLFPQMNSVVPFVGTWIEISIYPGIA